MEATGQLIAELGIGTNPNARLQGNIITDEKVLGTIEWPIPGTRVADWRIAELLLEWLHHLFHHLFQWR